MVPSIWRGPWSHKADNALPPELEYQTRHGNGDQDGDGSGWPHKSLTTQVAKRLTRTGLQESRGEQWWMRDGLRMGSGFMGMGNWEWTGTGEWEWEWGMGKDFGKGGDTFPIHLSCCARLGGMSGAPGWPHHGIHEACKRCSRFANTMSYLAASCHAIHCFIVVWFIVPGLT
jgi:hypothetical protein